MSLRDLLCHVALALILFPLISIMLGSFIEMWFKRKEKHIEWQYERMKQHEREDM